MHAAFEAIPRPSRRASLIWAIALVIVGILALTLPEATSFGVAKVLGWLILIHGIVQLFYAFRSEGVGRIVWKVLVAIL
ncbi:MAG TPA: DUF308 domain-containing protein, partial [Pseudacidobacterium sp.]|nr:DUF308 domain-containing protein [Pseudacidobacterium sp.]